MDTKRKIIFLALGFHKGHVNRLLHAVGVLFLLYAIHIQNIVYVVISIVVMELGHWYQYSVGSDSYKSQVKAVINIQIILIVFVISVLSVYFYYSAVLSLRE